SAVTNGGRIPFPTDRNSRHVDKVYSFLINTVKLVENEFMRSGFLPATPRNGYNGGQSSPRHPLYVDTQLANSIGEKRRSPATSVVDFIRGRSCATSVRSSCNIFSPSVSARASASTDGGVPTCDRISLAPLFSPVRGNSRHLSRIYHPGMRSLDSGLDLSSPTIGHHALLIKEVFPM
ncbi:unnamed protein product, partial [Angiostrongylus costaricensis]|uniref:Rho-GAP domain-containing protein n=1 Tax=Angiostrongylus costaricensis TaxID=334426 RepID=A0A0R3PM29_ANGCS